jgi:hypothetical protein
MTPAAFGTRAFVLTNAGSLLALRVTPPLSPAQSPYRLPL